MLNPKSGKLVTGLYTYYKLGRAKEFTTTTPPGTIACVAADASASSDDDIELA